MKKKPSLGTDYNDIIHLPNHRSRTRPHMPLIDRAAQFSPFAALSGHGEAIEETARLTEEKVLLTEEAKALLNVRLLLAAEQLAGRPRLSITYFVPDPKKSGGAYLTETGIIKKIDHYKHVILMENEVVIPLEDIVSIEGGIFEAMP